jgi:hypothetical protein
MFKKKKFKVFVWRSGRRANALKKRGACALPAWSLVAPLRAKA